MRGDIILIPFCKTMKPFTHFFKLKILTLVSISEAVTIVLGIRSGGVEGSNCFVDERVIQGPQERELLQQNKQSVDL